MWLGVVRRCPGYAFGTLASDTHAVGDFIRRMRILLATPIQQINAVHMRRVGHFEAE